MRKKIFPLFIILLLTSCNQISGSWKSSAITTKVIGFSATDFKNKEYVNPFNTSMTLRYFLNDKNDNKEETFNNAFALYESETIRLHKIFDRHYYYQDENGDLLTNVKVINDSYGTGKEIICSDELYNLLKIGVEAYSISDGYFNIFTGSLTDYWTDIFASLYGDGKTLEEIDPYFNVSQKEKLENLVKAIPNTLEDINKQLTFNDENKSVIFNKIYDGEDTYRPYLSVGGYAKGYATDLVKEKLVSSGYLEGNLISGGSSITSLGEPIHTSKVKGQQISTRNPNTYDGVAFSLVASKEFSYSTSGNYTTEESYAFYDNDNNIIYRHHILNPFTGYPMSYHRSVSILSYDISNAMMDVLSTAFMNLDVEEGYALKNKIREKLNINSLELFYLDQVGVSSDYTLTVYASSNVSSSLTLNEGVNVIYEK